jgi:hypothetical protein
MKLRGHPLNERVASFLFGFYKDDDLGSLDIIVIAATHSNGFNWLKHLDSLIEIFQVKTGATFSQRSQESVNV